MSLLDLRLQESRGSYPSGLDTQELREQNYGLIMKARNSNLINNINVATIEQSWGLPAVKVPVLGINKPTVTSGAMDCSFTTAESNGALVTITFIKGWVPVDLAYREGNALQLTNEQIFGRRFRDAQLAIYDQIEAAVFTTLDAAKATTYNSPFVGVGADFILTGDAMQVPTAQQDDFFNAVHSIMGNDNFPQTGLEVIGNTSLSRYISRFGNQGGANNTNLQFQFDGYNFGYSNSVTNTVATSSKATGFIFPANTLGMYSRVSPEARANRMTGDGIQWMTYSDELLGLDLEVMYKDGCADVSAKTGNADDVGGQLEQWKLGYQIALVTPYNTGTNGGIKKFDFVA